MKRRISTDQQQRFTDRLGHEQAVKRITVMERQLLKRQLRIGGIDRVRNRELTARLYPWPPPGARGGLTRLPAQSQALLR
jgi:hypothetical protein